MNLIISSHLDDEVIGCGGVLNSNCFVLFCGVQDFHIVPKLQRLDELINVSNFFGFDYQIINKDKVNHYDIHSYISVFEDVINRIRPDKVYVPFKSYNQDHQQIHDAAMVALRHHDKNFLVNKVLIYEETDCFWGNSGYTVNHFVNIDIDKKIKGYLLYESQVRGHRAPEHIKALAKLRGMQSNFDYAEAFIIYRWIDEN